MNFFKSYFNFDAQERRGILFLLVIIVLLQLFYMVTAVIPFKWDQESVKINLNEQAKIDSIKEGLSARIPFELYPFNPNFITDYKGYTLGMSPDEIDRLLVYRSGDNYVRSAEEFQKVTLVSDSLLKAISPYFKFPHWTQSDNNSQIKINAAFNTPKNVKGSFSLERTDLNTATAEDLKAINGIGEKLSERILKFRDRLGGFLVDEQLYDVYGLDTVVVERVLQRFKVLSRPEIVPVSINAASPSEIASLIYIPNQIAKKIVTYRQTVGVIRSFEELEQIEGFPIEKIDRIKLYLQL